MLEVKQLQRVSNGMTEHFPLYINWNLGQPDTPFHAHDFVEMVLVTRGNGYHLIGKRKIPIRQGDIFVVSRQQSHGYADCSEDLRVINLLFVPELLPMPLLDIPLLPGYKALFLCAGNDPETCPCFHVDENDFAFLCTLCEALIHENRTLQPGYRFNMMGLFVAMLGKLIQIYSREHKSAPVFFADTANVIAYLNQHFREKISIATLCSIAKMSKPTLMRNFVKVTGASPLQYKLQLCIAEAAFLLRTTDKNLTTIAFESGFTDSNYFGRQFRRITGKSPGEYRKATRRNSP